MENATKALLIAASVLIVIVLIAVGIKLLSSTQGVTNEVGELSGAMAQSVFNSQFTDYEGPQTGAEVKVLLNKAAATWRGNSSRNVKVNTYMSANDISTYRASIQINKTYYVVVLDNDNDEFVDTISIT